VDGGKKGNLGKGFNGMAQGTFNGMVSREEEWDGSKISPKRLWGSPKKARNPTEKAPQLFGMALNG